MQIVRRFCTTLNKSLKIMSSPECALVLVTEPPCEGLQSRTDKLGGDQRRACGGKAALEGWSE